MGRPAIGPGARVRTREGYIGSVERLEAAATGDQPKGLLVRSDDQRWRYRFPLDVVGRVTARGDRSIVHLQVDDTSLPQYVVDEAGDAPAATGNGRSKRQDAATEGLAMRTRLAADEAGTGDLRVPLAAEELIARTEPVELGTAHVHKSVQTFEHSVRVPVGHEEVAVEHLLPDEFDAGAPIEANTVVIPIMEERLVVQKQAFVKEYVRITKHTTTEEREINATLRREVLDVTPKGKGGPAEQVIVHDAHPGESERTAEQ